jgi:hypothetical protein
MDWKKLFGVALALAAAAVGASCPRLQRYDEAPLDEWGIPKGPVSLQFLESRPEAHLIYPGSHVITPLGYATDPQSGYAFYGGICWIKGAYWAQIAYWYDEWLRAHGYHLRDNWVLDSGPHITGFVWDHPSRRLGFDLALDDPKLLYNITGIQAPTGEGIVVYEYTYSVVEKPYPDFPSRGPLTPPPDPVPPIPT